MRRAPAHLSLAESRRIALGAQGFNSPRPQRVTPVRLAALMRQIGLLQLDFVNVVCPSHYIVPFSRLGAYPRQTLHDVIYRSGQFTEQWAHEASVVPMETWPLLRDRREVHRARPWGFNDIMRRHHAYVDTVMDHIRARGPAGPSDMADPTHTPRRLPGSWYGNVPRAVLEACFGRGRLAVTDRRQDFSRVFDLAERVVPTETYARHLDVDDAHRELLRQAARAHGVGTAADLADYFRMPVSTARPRLAELVEAGILSAVTVEGWREPAYLNTDAVVPPTIRAAALLSPFDPVIWFRPRTARLFAFDYRFEIFIPAARRRWGAYVLPFLLGDRLVARVDLKADRAAGTLLVQGAFIEKGADLREAADALAAELCTMARWLGLSQVKVGRRGSLAPTLRRACSAFARSTIMDG